MAENENYLIVRAVLLVGLFNCRPPVGRRYPHQRKWDSGVMNIPVVNVRAQRRPTLRVDAIDKLIADCEGEEQVLYVLLAATGMRISKALALEARHFVNGSRSIQIRHQVHRKKPVIIERIARLKLSADVTEYLREFINGKNGLPFQTRNSTPYMHYNRSNLPATVFWTKNKGTALQENFFKKSLQLSLNLHRKTSKTTHSNLNVFGISEPLTVCTIQRLMSYQLDDPGISTKTKVSTAFPALLDLELDPTG